MKKYLALIFSFLIAFASAQAGDLGSTYFGLQGGIGSFPGATQAVTPWGLMAGRKIEEHIRLNLFFLSIPYESSLTLMKTNSSVLGADLHYCFGKESGFHAGLKLGWLPSDPGPGLVFGPSIGYDLPVAPNFKIGLEATTLRIPSGGFINLLMGQLKYELK